VTGAAAAFPVPALAAALPIQLKIKNRNANADAFRKTWQAHSEFVRRPNLLKIQSIEAL
jgi:hypothetical protein